MIRARLLVAASALAGLSGCVVAPVSVSSPASTTRVLTAPASVDGVPAGMHYLYG